MVVAGVQVETLAGVQAEAEAQAGVEAQEAVDGIAVGNIHQRTLNSIVNHTQSKK